MDLNLASSDKWVLGPPMINMQRLSMPQQGLINRDDIMTFKHSINAGACDKWRC